MGYTEFVVYLGVVVSFGVLTLGALPAYFVWQLPHGTTRVSRPGICSPPRRRAWARILVYRGGMGSGPSSFFGRYSLAIVLTALAVLATLILAPHWNPRHLLLPFYPAVMLSAWFGGFGPGLLTTLLSALAMDYFWLPPAPGFGIREPGDLMGFILFLGVGLLVSMLNARLLRAQRHAEAVAAEMRHRSEEHTSELQSLRHLVCRLLLEKKKPPQTQCEQYGHTSEA